MLPERETIPTSHATSFRWKRFMRAGANYEWHFHPEMELTLLISGHGQRYVGDHIEAFGPGDLVLLGPNLPHTWHTREADRETAESVVIQFNLSVLGEGLGERPETEGLARLVERSRRGLWFPVGHRGVPEMMKAMEHARGYEHWLGLMRVLGELAAEPDAGRPLSGEAHALPPRLDDQRRIDRVCRLLAEQYTQPIRQTDAAEAVQMSPSSFSRFFKRMTGRTFVAYLHELRIAEACRRLADADRDITGIAYGCGFDNIANFNRVFRRLRHTTPRDYRRALQPH